MEEDLISKKDLLNITGISYGQLYRWKRKNIIPEEWFIKKSSFTGQETFFPKDKILDRINKIKDMKDDLSLDELADRFSPEPSKIVLNKNYISQNKVVEERILDIYESIAGSKAEYKFEDVLCMYILQELLSSGDVTLEEGKNFITMLVDNYENIKGKNYDLIFIRKLGVGTWIIVSTNVEFYMEEGAKLIVKASISKYIEELKLKIEK